MKEPLFLANACKCKWSNKFTKWTLYLSIQTNALTSSETNIHSVSLRPCISLLICGIDQKDQIVKLDENSVVKEETILNS